MTMRSGSTESCSLGSKERARASERVGHAGACLNFVQSEALQGHALEPPGGGDDGWLNERG